METDKPLGVPTIARAELTLPQSPAITKPKPKVIVEPEKPKPFKANPLKEVEPFVPVVEHKHTQPINLEMPGEVIRGKKMKKFEEEMAKKKMQEDAVRNFKAQPLPSDSPEVRERGGLVIPSLPEI